MNKLLITLVIACLTAGPALGFPPADWEQSSHRMLDELGQLGADIKPLRPQVSRIDKHLDEIGISSANSKEEILGKLEEFKPNLSDDFPLYQAINVLLRLSALTDDCYKGSYNALAQAYLLIGGEPRELFKTKSTVASFVLKIAEEHQKRCLPEYAKLYTSELAKIDKSVVQDLENLFDDEYFMRLHGPIPVEQLHLHHLIRSVYGLIDYIVNQLKKNDFKVWQRGVVGTMLNNNKRKDPEYYREYLVSRCRNFNNYLGSVFAPARFDSMIFNAWPSDLCRSAGTKFCQHWRIYRVCLAHFEINRNGDLIQRMRLLGKPLKSNHDDHVDNRKTTEPINPVLLVAALGG